MKEPNDISIIMKVQLKCSRKGSGQAIRLNIRITTRSYAEISISWLYTISKVKNNRIHSFNGLTFKKWLELGMGYMIIIVTLSKDYLHDKQTPVHVWKSIIKWIQKKQIFCYYRNSLRNWKYCSLPNVRFTSKLADQVLNIELGISVNVRCLWNITPTN